MAASGFTPISLYYSTTASAVPTSGNLANGELALNIADMKLYAKNSAGTVTLLASSGGAAGTVSSVAVSGGTTGLTTSGGPITTSGTITLAGTLATTNGGTGLTSFTSGGVVYASSSSALATGTALTLDASNSLLVGTTTVPTTGGIARSIVSIKQLNDTSYTSGIQIEANANTNVFGIGYNGSTFAIGTTYRSTGSYVPISFFTSDVERVRITSAGDVGIGTSSPAERLDVSVNSANGGGMRISNPSQANQFLSIFMCGSSGYGQNGWDNSAVIEANAASVGSGTRALYLGAYNGPVIFATGSSSRNVRAQISSVGNLLIGGTAARGTTAGEAHLDLFNGTAPAGTLTNGVSLYSSSGDLKFMDSAGNAYGVGFRNVPQSGSSKTSSYTLATTDVGEYILLGASGAIVIPDATFAAGDVVSIFNNTASTATITCSITTAYIAGTFTDKATMTLAAAGVATVLFISGTVCVVSGNVT